MVGPAAKRAAVAHLQDTMGLSERRACSIVGADRRRSRYGTIRISVCERAIERYAAMALMKRSPKMTAN